MTTINAVFEVPEDTDPETLMGEMERAHGIVFDEFHEAAEAPLRHTAEKEPEYDDFRWSDAILSVPGVRRDEIAVTGRVQVVAEADEFWGGGESKDYRSAIMLNPTWEELTKVLDEQMKVTRDYHHCFLEGVYGAVVENGVKTVRLALGS